jgi:hypothetical protein
MRIYAAGLTFQFDRWYRRKFHVTRVRQCSTQVSGAVDCFYGLAQFVGERVGGGDDVRPGLDLDGPIATAAVLRDLRSLAAGTVICERRLLDTHPAA